jgi:hypothetical protein
MSILDAAAAMTGTESSSYLYAVIANVLMIVDKSSSIFKEELCAPTPTRPSMVILHQAVSSIFDRLDNVSCEGGIDSEKSLPQQALRAILFSLINKVCTSLWHDVIFLRF